MCLRDPPIPADVAQRIREEADTGKYGPRSNFTRADVFNILHALEMREREKQRQILQTTPQWGQEEARKAAIKRGWIT